MLKKVISESKSLGNLHSDSARLLYTWLIPWLDIEGRHSADPEIIKGHIFPKVKTMTISRIKGLLDELSQAGLIILYRDNDEICLQLIKFKEHQSLKPDREAPSKIAEPKPENIITPENSGLNPENSPLSKVKISKVKIRISPSPEKDFGPLFEEFWKQWPPEGRFKKKNCRTKFLALCKKGKLEDFKKTTIGYFNVLEHKEKNEGFRPQAMYLSTWLNNWEEDRERYVDSQGNPFKYQPRL